MSELTAHVVKNETINLRATARQKNLLRQAAEATDHSLTDFILDSAVDQAERVLADRRWFAATDDEFAEFVRLLDAPLPTTERFDRLFSRQSRFSDDAS